MSNHPNARSNVSTNTPSARHAHAGGPAATPHDLAFHDLVSLVTRWGLTIRSRWIAGAVAAAVLGGLVAYGLLSRPPEYTARTILFARGTFDKVIGTQGSAASNDALGLQLENTLRNHLSVMAGRSFQSRVISSLSPAERSAVAEPYLPPGQVASDDFLHGLLENKVTVERERGREFFTIDVKHRNAATALLLAGRVGNEYLALVQNQFRDANKEGFTLLEGQARGLRKEIAKAEDDRLDFRKQNQIMSLADSQGILAERLKRVDAARTDARILRIRLETLLTQVQASTQASAFPWDNAYLANYATNPVLHKDLDTLANQRAVLATRYGPSHPRMHDLDAAMAGITANIRHNFEVATQDLAIQLQAARRTEADFQTEFDEGFAKSIETAKLASRSDIFATDIEVKKQNLLQLEKRIAEAGLYSQMPVDFMQIADPAYLVRPLISVRAIQVAVAGILALVFFAVTPLVLDLLDPRLKSNSDPEALLQLRLLGVIPVLKASKRHPPAHVVRDGVDQAGKDALSDVIAELELLAPSAFPKVILVSSALPGEGKSVLVSNLAAGYIARDRRVVILDLDLRRPSQDLLQGASGTGGFLPWIAAGLPAEHLLEPGGLLGLQRVAGGSYLIPAGGEERGPNHRLAEPAMGALVAALKLRFDVILIDTPPAGLFHDALLLGRLADVRLLVTRVARSAISQILRVITAFEDTQAPLTGLIMNGFIPRDAEATLAQAYRGGRAAYYRGTPAMRKVPVPAEANHNPVHAGSHDHTTA